MSEFPRLPRPDGLSGTGIMREAVQIGCCNHRPLPTSDQRNTESGRDVTRLEERKKITRAGRDVKTYVSRGEICEGTGKRRLCFHLTMLGLPLR